MATVSETATNLIPQKLSSASAPSTPTESSSSSQASIDSELPSSEKKMPEFFWMVKPCFVYKDEHKDCKSFRGRFNQYFVNGSLADCTQWKDAHDNCVLWDKKEDMAALKKVIEGEKSRVKQRLRNHYANDVWEHRTSPPEDWNKELPEPIKKSYEHTLLKKKADGLKSGEEKFERLAGGDPRALEDSFCSIV